MLPEGYLAQEKLYEKSDVLFCRAVEETSARTVLVKSLQGEFPALSKIARFKHEYHLLSELNIPHIPRPCRLIEFSDRIAIVFNDLPGALLSDCISSFRLEVVDFLLIAQQLAHLLGEMHQKGIIHKHINPYHILYDPKSHTVSLIDFESATTFAKEQLEFNTVVFPEAELHYISPEQTGKMNRSVTMLTDMYSLGVTLYKVWTGELPFQEEDEAGLLHAHMVRNPISPHILRPDTPHLVADIMMKLMQKNPEERYQSGFGLEKDIEKCLNLLKAGHREPSFLLGEGDFSPQLSISDKLYGREHALQQLLNAFQFTCKNKIQLVLVRGEAGVGKTALVNQIEQEIIKGGGHFITGKFDQFQRRDQYRVLAQAFQRLISQVLTSFSASEIEKIRLNLIEALNINAQLIINFVPELETLIGPQPPLPDLSPQEAENRLAFTVRDFIHVFTSLDHPLVMFLDDFQWIDEPSLFVLKHIAMSPVAKNIMIILCYRDKEITKESFMLVTLEEMREKVKTLTITLPPMSLEDVKHLVHDTLREQGERIDALATILYEKTKGNPFFIRSLLVRLYDNGLLYPDNFHQKWGWDTKKIRALPVSNNVVSFMIDELQLLPKATQKILHIASLLGNSFYLKPLAIAAHKTENEVIYLLWPALTKNIILPLSKDYHLFSTNLSEEIVQQKAVDLEKIEFKFSHDRISQAANSLSTPEVKRKYQYKASMRLLKKLPPNMLKKQFINIVSMLNEARHLIRTHKTYLRLIRYNLEAASRSLNSFAYESAYAFITTAMEMAPKNLWETEYAFAYKLHELYCECAFYNKRYQESLQQAHILLEKATTNLKKAEIAYKLSMYVASTAGGQEESIKYGLLGLSYLGISLPKDPHLFPTFFKLVLHKISRIGRKIENCRQLPKTHDPKNKLVQMLFANLIQAAYRSDRIFLVALASTKSMRYSLTHGNSDASLINYIYYGSLWPYNSLIMGKKLGKIALELAKGVSDPNIQGQVYFSYAFVMHFWHYSLDDLKAYYEYAIQKFRTAGNIEQLAFAYDHIIYLDTRPLPIVYEEGARYTAAIYSLGIRSVFAHSQLCQNFRAHLMGIISEKGGLSTSEYQEDQLVQEMEEGKFYWGIINYYNLKQQIDYLFEEYGAAFTHAKKLAPYKFYLFCSYSYIELCVYHFLIYAALYKSLNIWKKAKARFHMRVEMFKMSRWYLHNPDNFSHYYFLMKAEHARISKKQAKAAQYYRAAIHGAEKNNSLLYQALSNELAAKFHLALGKSEEASLYMQKSAYHYSQWGAKAKVGQLKKDYVALFEEHPHKEASEKGSHKHKSLLNKSYDLSQIIKMTHTMVREVHLAKLMSKILLSVSEACKAEKSVCILERNQDLFTVGYSDSGGNVTDLLSYIPLEKEVRVAKHVVRHVYQTQKPAILSNAAQNIEFIDDPYIVEQVPKSILCIPILDKKVFLGVLYLENNTFTNFFTEERVTFLEILSGYMAISIQNALSYEGVSRFLPTLFLKLSGKSHLTEIELGDTIYQTMTVLLLKVQIFPGASEKIGIDKSFEIIHAFLDHITSIIQVHQGFIQRHMGDTLQIFFPYSPKSALEAGIAILKELHAYNQEWLKQHEAPIQIGIGIDTGMTLFRMVGDKNHMDVAILSEAIDFAIQLEGVTRVYQAPLMVSQLFINSLLKPEEFKFRYLDTIYVRGRSCPVKIYENYNADFSERVEKKDKLQTPFSQGISLYKGRQFSEALPLFKKCQSILPDDKSIALYVKRCKKYIKTPPPPDWEAAHRLR